MFIKLILLALASVVVAQNAPPWESVLGRHIYTSVSSKHISENVPAVTSHHVIEPGKCNLVLNKVQLCGNYKNMGVEVSVSDAVPFPTIIINNDLDRVLVFRKSVVGAKPCYTRAHVTLKLKCQPLMSKYNRPTLIQVQTRSSESDNLSF